MRSRSARSRRQRRAPAARPALPRSTPPLRAQAWSPLGSGKLARSPRDTERVREACARIGSRYGKSAAQVALRWLTQVGVSYSVQSQSAAHFREDADVFDFELSAGDMAELNGLNAHPAASASAAA